MLPEYAARRAIRISSWLPGAPRARRPRRAFAPADRGTAAGATVIRAASRRRRTSVPRSRLLAPVVIAVAGMLLAACGSQGSPSASSPRRDGASPPPAARVLAPIAVGGSPTAIAIGAGSVWVADQARGRVLRLDPQTRRPAGPAIRVGKGPVALAVGDGGVWVAHGDGQVRSIDPETGVVRPGSVRVSGADGLAVGAGGVWVTNRIAGTVTRIDPATRRPDRPVRVGAGAADVVVADGAVWVANGAAGTISRVDPATGEVAAPIRSGAPAVLALAAGDGGLWVARAGGRVGDRLAVVRLDPARRAVTGKAVAVSGAVPLDLAAGAGSVWATDAGSVLPLGAPRPAGITRIDPRSGPARTGGPLRVGRRPSAVAVGAGGLWVADAADGTVTPISVGG